MKNFCLDLREHVTKIINYEKKEMIPLTEEEEKMHNKQKVCHICKKRFTKDNKKLNDFFFSMWIFFHEHSRITGLQGKGEGISLTPHYQFHTLHRHLDISRAITAELTSAHS